MTISILRSVRFAFVTLLLALTVFTVAESAVAGGAGATASAKGLDACGSPEQPCLMAPVSVSVNARPDAARLASTERMPRMMLRAGS